MGHLSPLDGIGPDELELDKLGAILDEDEVKEVILATNSTVEGEATAHFIGEMARNRNKRVTRLAHGVPRRNTSTAAPSPKPSPAEGKCYSESAGDFTPRPSRLSTCMFLVRLSRYNWNKSQ